MPEREEEGIVLYRDWKKTRGTLQDTLAEESRGSAGEEGHTARRNSCVNQKP